MYSIKMNSYIAIAVYLAENVVSFKTLASIFCNFGQNFISWFTLAATALLTADVW